MVLTSTSPRSLSRKIPTTCTPSTARRISTPRHRFTAAFTYDVPKLAGPNWIAQGWQLNTIVTAQSGRPVPIVSANDTSAQNGDVYPTPSNYHQRPNLVPGINPVNSNWRSAPDSIGYLNGAAFAQPDYAAPENLIGSFGNLGRNAIYGRASAT